MAHGSQSSQIGILSLVAMFRVDPTAVVYGCAMRMSSGREERISRDEGETRRCRARSRATAIIRARRHVYAIGELSSSSLMGCSLVSEAHGAGSRARKGGGRCRPGIHGQRPPWHPRPGLDTAADKQGPELKSDVVSIG